MSVSGTILGDRYRLEEPLGRGGMATVWRAYDSVLDRSVALKRLHTRLHGDAELHERFRREGRMVAGLSHPNLVRLLDQGEHDNEPFLVFELVEGRDLKSIIRSEGALPADRAAAICSQIARALGVAHRAGVIHRDIKSHNVLVTDDDTAKLTDFGIARIANTDRDLTRTGIVIGSSDYLSPEQAEGKPLDGRSDLYSLGVVLYEALTGVLPFTGENPVAVATKHVFDVPADPRTHEPSIPEPIATACLTALSKAPRERFATGEAFADALEGRRAVTGAPQRDDDGDITGRMKAVRRRSAGRTASLLVAVLGIAAAGAAIVTWGPGIRGGSDASGDVVSLAYAVSDYDPLGDSQEHSSEVPLVADGDASTQWTTETYRSSVPTFGKEGVGLEFTLEAPTRIREIHLTTTSSGAVAQILGPGLEHSDRSALTEPIQLGDGTTTIGLGSQNALSNFVVWFTEPGSIPREDGAYEVGVGQVEVFGVANS